MRPFRPARLPVTPPARLPRRAVLPLAAAGLAATLMSCSATTSDAMTVNGTKFSKDSIRRELEAMKRNEAFRAVLARDNITVEGRPNSTFDSRLVSIVLRGRIQDHVIAEEFAAQKLTLDPATPPELLVQAEGQYGGKESFSAFPEDFRERILVTFKRLDALSKAEAKQLGDPETFFKANPGRFPAQVCASHVLVKTAAEAQRVRARLVAGEELAKVAGEVSLDTGSGGQGGSLGCAPPETYVKEFADTLRVLPVNQLSDPVQTQYGFHVIKVTERKVGYAALKSDVEAALAQQSQESLFGRLRERLRTAKVTIDPAYGSWKDGELGPPGRRPGGSNAAPSPLPAPTAGSAVPGGAAGEKPVVGDAPPASR